MDTTEWKCEVASEEVGGVGAGEGGWPQGINVPEQLLLDCPPLPVSLPFLPQSFSSLSSPFPSHSVIFPF